MKIFPNCPQLCKEAAIQYSSLIARLHYYYIMETMCTSIKWFCLMNGLKFFGKHDWFSESSSLEKHWQSHYKLPGCIKKGSKNESTHHKCKRYERWLQRQLADCKNQFTMVLNSATVPALTIFQHQNNEEWKKKENHLALHPGSLIFITCTCLRKCSDQNMKICIMSSTHSSSMGA